MSTKWRSYGIFFQRSRLLVRSFFSQTKFPLLAFNLSYEGFSDCLLMNYVPEIVKKVAKPKQESASLQ